ncbi:hypothetical protein LIA77_07554 [Sarocladium implicatum]|nr:hypothetical protein LIA77_07554 [Sarocladium implicatum]
MRKLDRGPSCSFQQHGSGPDIFGEAALRRRPHLTQIDLTSAAMRASESYGCRRCTCIHVEVRSPFSWCVSAATNSNTATILVPVHYAAWVLDHIRATNPRLFRPDLYDRAGMRILVHIHRKSWDDEGSRVSGIVIVLLYNVQP